MQKEKGMRQFFVVALLVLLAPARLPAQNAAQRMATMDFLQKLQTPGGGFLPGPRDAKMASLRATAAAVRALHYFGGPIPDKNACVTFVASCHDAASGGFRDRPGAAKPDAVTTSIGLMAIVDLKMPRNKYESGAVEFLCKQCKTFEEIRLAAAAFEAIGKPSPRAKEWLERIDRMRNPDSSFGKGPGRAHETGSAAAAILRLGGHLENSAGAVKIMRDGQRPDGGFGPADPETASNLDSTYRVMRSFMMLKERPADTEAVRSFVHKCRNRDGGYGVMPGRPSTAAGTYYAGIILHWLDRP
jgi:hypothetical protein